jgi:hypothetical protein
METDVRFAVEVDPLSHSGMCCCDWICVTKCIARDVL